MGKFKGVIFVLALALVLAPFVNAADFDHVVTNSEDWKDVYSGIHYATLSGVQSDFLTSQNHASILLDSLGKSKTIKVVSSKNNPYVFNYADSILSKGFSGSEEVIYRNSNLELIKELPNVKNFIVVDSSYGYGAMAVVPYAVKKNSWVFFSNNINIEEIDSVLANREVKELIIYGYVDREVRDVLEKYSPVVINNQDKFEDNIKIVEKYLAISPTKQALLTNGEFIEKELMTGTQPILFTGRQNVPDKIRDYLKTSDIEIGVLVGNELMGAATNIRRSAGISVMVKFARGARNPGAGISAVEGLDLFPLPVPSLKLEIYSVEYNKLSGQLEVTYKSSANTPGYFKGTITINQDGDKIKVGDTEAIFISPGSYKTVTYPIGLKSYDDLKAQVFTIYGESKDALDRVIDASYDVKVIDVIDRCQIEILKVTYNKQKNQFEIDVKNTENVNCWVDVSIEDLLIGYEEKTISTDRAYKIEAGKKITAYIREEMFDSDLEKNKFVDVVAHFGEKETSLVKVLSGNFELRISSLSTVTYVMAGMTLAIGGFFFLFFLRRRKERADDFDF